MYIYIYICLLLLSRLFRHEGTARSGGRRRGAGPTRDDELSLLVVVYTITSVGIIIIIGIGMIIRIN